MYKSGKWPISVSECCVLPKGNKLAGVVYFTRPITGSLKHIAFTLGGTCRSFILQL